MRDDFVPGYEENCFYIYALVCAVTGERCYVGYTENPWGRLGQHRSAARSGKNLPLYDWIRSLSGYGVEIEILEKVETTDEARNREVWWYDKLRLHGSELLNAARPNGRNLLKV